MSYSHLRFSLQDQEGRKFGRGQTMVEPADHLLTVDMGRGGGQRGQKTRENPLDFPFKQEVHLAQFLSMPGKNWSLCVKSTLQVWIEQ
jgi:hypothetical protein